MSSYKPLSELLEILSYRRPYDLRATQGMIKCAESHVAPLGAMVDAYGNYHLDIGPTPTILWSAHLDTVHRIEGRQRIVADRNGFICLPDKSPSNCLGADDSAGIWLLCEMARAGIHGRYVWHVGEERGGIGSDALAREGSLLYGIQAAIAFDRRGMQDIITHQMGRCASDNFARSLASALAIAGIAGYRPDNSGMFTDTANYIDIVPECSNVSVGYYAEHTSSERLDIRHILALRDALCQIDTSGLVIERDPTSFDDSDYWPDHGLSTPGIWRYRMDDTGEDNRPNIPATSDDTPWIADDEGVYHCPRYDWLRTGVVLCGATVSEALDYWTEDSWDEESAPAFCDECLEREALQNEPTMFDGVAV